MSKQISAISVKNFNFFYDTQPILENISLEIQQYKVTAIIGSNGCGKSTFLKSLNRMAELEKQVKIQGKVEFFGQNIYERRVNLNRLRRQINLVYPQPNLFPLSIYDNIAYGVKLIGWYPKAELDNIIESAIIRAGLWEELKHRLHKPALELSHGQQQRLCIARALAVKPQVLLLDDFCAGLDPSATFKIEELIQRIRSEITIVIVAQNMQQVSRLADFIAMFNYNENRVGQLLEFAPTAKLVQGASDFRHRDYAVSR
ncbi:MAG TPA: ATP-binding cassette domain-containing protein [Nostocaceae cyanobacterium]|nr:ATP-binding cassette domain-containing protein [Nostocaceae cyanobacterium]